MQGLIALLIIVGLVGVVVHALIEYWWVVAIVVVVAGAIYAIVKYSDTSMREPPATRAGKPPVAQSRPVPPARPSPLHAPAPTPPPGRPKPQSQRPKPQRSKPAAAAPPPQEPPAIASTLLTRRQTGFPAKDAVYTALDVETTGLDPETCRIVEIGLVKFTAGGTVLDEFATLINNPRSSREARDVHQIDDSDLLGAPDTADVLPEVFAFMAGTVLVAHNLEFEEGCLAAAARRAGIAMPPIVGLCTLRTSRRQLDGRAYSLTVMHKTATGDFPPNKHTALGDARSAMEILLWLLRSAPKPLHLTAAPPPPAEPGSSPECRISCRPVGPGSGSVAELLASFPQSTRPRTGDPVEVEKYLAVLAESVEDGLLSYEEARALTSQARKTRLNGNQLRDLHRQAWDTTFADDKDADWASLSPVRRREMYLLADALGLPDLADRVNEAIEACAEPQPPPEGRYLRSLRIGIVGDDEAIVSLRARAETYGAKIAVNITKTVVWMATTTPDATDSKHNSARKFGIPMLTPAAAADRLSDSIREAEIRAHERQREIDEHAARRQQYQAEQEAYWRPTWRPKELDHDPEPDYEWS